MWGKAGESGQKIAACRITPTHVGKSIVKVGKDLPQRDHPHPCGEKLRALMPLHLVSGSPPPMWGKDSRLKIRAR